MARYLRRRVGKSRSGDRWYVRVPVPPELRPRFGPTIDRSLETGDRREAQRRSHAAIVSVQAMLQEAALAREVHEAQRARASHTAWSRAYVEHGAAGVRDMLEAIIRRDAVDGEYDGDQLEEIEAALRVLEGRPPPHIRVCLGDLLADWERERRPAERTKLDFGRALRRLEEHVSHDDAARLRREDIEGFRDVVLERGSWKTAFNTIGAVRAVLGVAVRRGMLESNPAAGVAVRKAPGARSRLPFDDAEAAEILEAVRRQSGFRRWVPWLLAYSGARLEEVCQARVHDIRQDRGIWHLDITPDAGSLKNAGSARKVPLHPALVAEGFLDYVGSLPTSGPLFPDLKPDRFGRRGGTATKVLGRQIRKLGITDPRKVAGHSWRHRFKDLCRGAGIEKAVHDALTGHASGDVGDGYGLGYDLPVLRAAIDRLPDQTRGTV